MSRAPRVVTGGAPTGGAPVGGALEVRENQAGFTLLEMLVALSILSLMAAGIFASLGSSATHTVRVKARLESQQALRTALQHIASDIEGVYWVKGAQHLFFTGKRGDGGKGRRDELEFTAMRRRLRRRGERSGDLVSIAYSLSTATGEQKLIRTESLMRGGKESLAAPPATLVENVESVAFEYLDREAGKSSSWTANDENKDDVSLPAAVRVTLGIAGEKKSISMLIPIPMGLRAPVEPIASVPVGTGTTPNQPGGEGESPSTGGAAPPPDNLDPNNLNPQGTSP